MRNFELSLENAKRICEKFNLPTPIQVVRLEEGMINDVFSIDKKYVIKINTGHPNVPKLKKEVDIYKLLSGKVAVPKVYGFDDSKKVLSYSYIIMQHVEGSSLGFKYATLSEIEKKEWLAKLGELLASIHSIEFDKFGETFSNEEFQGDSNYKDFIKKYIENICVKIEDSRELDKQEIDKVRSYFSTNPLFNINPKASLLHGNFIQDSILVLDNDIKAVVDWEWCRSGHNEERSEERRVGKECRSRWSPDH